MKNKTHILLLALITLFFSCSNKEDEITNDPLLDMGEFEMTTEGFQTMIDHFNQNSDYKFNGELISVGSAYIDGDLSLKNSIDTENITLIKILSENEQLIEIYSSPSSKTENEIVVFTQYNGIIINEIKFNFTTNSDGTPNFTSEFTSKMAAKSAGWGSCMQGFFTDPTAGTLTAVMSVATGVGCVPCGGVAAFLTGVAALGCLM